MEKIASFQVDHLKLKSGVFVSRKDCFGGKETSRDKRRQSKYAAGRSPDKRRSIASQQRESLSAGGTVLTTFDLRFKEPNKEPVMDQPALHTIEHLGATFLRSHPEWARRTVYFGPMGCRTGFYVILEGDLRSEDILPLLTEMLDWIENFDGPIPGAAAAECGNWREQNLDMAKWECRRYAAIVKNPGQENLNYP